MNPYYASDSMLAHETALDQFEEAGWTYEYPGFFETFLPGGRVITCAFDLSNSGKWEVQIHRDPDGGPVVHSEDFATVDAVIGYVNSL